jgi:hypothetical protein
MSRYLRLILASLSTAWAFVLVGCGEPTESEARKAAPTKPGPPVRWDKGDSDADDEHWKRVKKGVEGKLQRGEGESGGKAGPTRVLVPIRSYTALDAYREAGNIKGQRIRVTGEAEVKRTERGVHAIFWHPRGGGRRIATVSVKNDDAGPLADLKVGEGMRMAVNLETIVRGISAAQLVLEHSEFLPLDAPEGFVEVDVPPPPAPKEPEKTGPEKEEPDGPYTIINDPITGQPRKIPVPRGKKGGKGVDVRGQIRSNGTYVPAQTGKAPATDRR